MNDFIILQIAVPVPFRKLFDYLPIPGTDPTAIKPGIRVEVPFGRTIKVGILVKQQTHSDVPLNKLKAVHAYLDPSPVFDQQHLAWLLWISQYYHHPIGDTLHTALPVLLRKDKAPSLSQQHQWQISDIGLKTPAEELNRAPKQKDLLLFFTKYSTPLNSSQLNKQLKNWRSPLKALINKGLVKQIDTVKIEPTHQTMQLESRPVNEDQQKAIQKICQRVNTFAVFLLDGITGSGKTEVYLNSMLDVIKSDRQVLVLIPEIGLTPQLVTRFTSRFGPNVATLHSGMNDTERYQTWRRVKNNQTKILIGTRSAIFTPMPHLGMIIIDEEHDLSFKQQDGLRYSARDIAITRAQRLNIPVILGSATPSLESLLNSKRGSFEHLLLRQRAGNSKTPKIQTLDVKGLTLTENFSRPLLDLIKQHLAKHEQVMIFINRRGFAPTMICQECGWVAMCHRCDHPMTIHAKKQRVICHHCGYEHKMPSQCPSCSSIDLRPRGYGTERTEKVLQELFPDTEIIRIDRDTTSRKNAMHDLLSKVANNKAQILLGTQMLAKGHDFPNITLVAILDADQGLFGADLRSSERMAQLITQVAGRAGRGEKKGRVLIQTHHPDHPLLNVLIHQGYASFSQNALEERKLANLPPYSSAALLRAESTTVGFNIQFLMDIKNFLQQCNTTGLEILGPAPSPQERRAGKFRTQLLFVSQQRKALHQLLDQCLNYIEKLKSAKRVRWHLDVDPQDLS